MPNRLQEPQDRIIEANFQPGPVNNDNKITQGIKSNDQENLKLPSFIDYDVRFEHI